MAEKVVEVKRDVNPTVTRRVETVYSGKKFVEGGGFVVRRPLGSPELSYCDPFLMLDHFGPIRYGPGEAVGAPDHPHRGFETVSYILSGGMQHKDSRGNHGDLQPGDVQWMTAGSGVVHSEMPSDDIMKNGGVIEGFQLWVNLPKVDKMIAPRYQDTRSNAIPEVLLDTADCKGKVRVIAGQCRDKRAVIGTRTPMMYLDIQLAKTGSIFETEVASEFNGFAYFYRGTGLIGANKEEIKEGQIAVLGAGDTLLISSTSDDARLLLIAGRPLNEPVARHGPFVMNQQSEIRQAFMDYQSGKMGSIAGADERRAQTQAALSKSGGPLSG